MKRPFTLTEVLVASVLFVFIFSLLFASYHHLGSQKKRQERVKEEAIKVAHFDSELEAIFSKVKDPYYFFSSEGPSLIFTYNRGVAREAELSGEVLARLFLDGESGCLMVAIFPHPSKKVKEPSKALLLVEGASDLGFEFYFPKLESQTVDPEKVGNEYPKTGWQPVWRKEFNQLPAMVKITFNREGCERKGGEREGVVLSFKYDIAAFSLPPKVAR